jgi:TolB-like protein/DNA-binding winged helix-turn-helix (wHTH) protein/Tfp pilus assembly protein PilF
MDTGRPPQLGAIRFGVFEVDLRAGELRKQGVKVKLQEQPCQLLQILLERPGQVVTREELRQRIWPSDTFVDFDGGVNNAVRRLREALGDKAETPRFIETLPRRGYRFIGSISDSAPTPASGWSTMAGLPSTTTQPKRALRIGVLIGFASAGLLLALAGFAPHRWWPQQRGSVPQIQSIAVLPLQNLSGDPEQEYFAEGLTDQLITDLARIGGLRVISRTSIVGYQRTSKRTPAIARELGVDGIVEGTVERDHGRVRIRVQLINAHTDEHFWAASFDGDGNDAFRLEADVASDVAQQIGRRLTARTNQSPSPGIPAPLYEEYLKGRYYWNKRTPEGLTKAITQFEQVIQQAPRFAPAYSGLADCYNLLTVYEDTMPADTFSKAKAAAMKAVELDEGLGAAHASLGEIYFRFDWDWEAAEKEFRRAIELEPGYSTAHHWYAEYLVAMGRFDEGIAETEKALELDPLSLIINADAGWFFEMAGKSDRALLQLHRTLELEPRFSPTHLYLGEAYLRKEMYPQAIAAYRESASLGDSSSSAPLGYAYGRAGKRAEAKKIIEQLHRRPNMSPTSIAIVYAGLGDKNRAFALLERAFKEHDDSLIYVRSQTFFDPLRSEPRFQALLRRMAFPR